MELGKDPFDGTFSFCEKCPKASSCCMRVRPRGQIGCPLLLPQEVRNIQGFTGLPVDAFSIAETSSSLRVIKATSKGCIFFCDGVCTIYRVRPVDCRLFPFDLVERDGKLVWIAYTNVCPQPFDAAKYLEQARRLLPGLGEHQFEYAQSCAPWMDGEPYVELGVAK